jgi:hypothetical protein
MANENPLFLFGEEEEKTFVTFEIPKEWKDTNIYVTVKVEIDNEKWFFQSYNIATLGINSIYPDTFKLPVDLKLGYGSAIHNKKFSISSRVDRFRNDDPNSTPPIANCTLIIEAGDKNIAEFKKASTKLNPTVFYAKIKFKQL